MTKLPAAAMCAALLLPAPALATRHRRPVARPALPPIVWAAPPQDAPPREIVIWAPPPVVSDVPPLPPEARDLIEKAIASGDQAKAKTVIAIARETFPQGGAQLDALAAEADARAAAKAAQAARERADRLAAASFLDLWKGEIEVGGSRNTGNTDTLALYGGIKLNREGLRWRQALSARADYQRTDDTTSVEKITAQWQPQYKLRDRFYVYGLAQYDHDRFLGLASRYALGTGIGYGIVARPTLKIDFEGGPAVRRTDYTSVANVGRSDATTLAARGSLTFDWKPIPTLELKHNTALFLESGDSSLVATTALDTKLIGPLKARFSYDVNYESNPGTAAKNLDTVSRAALVYAF